MTGENVSKRKQIPSERNEAIHWAVGCTGFLLTPILILGNYLLIDESAIVHSISRYYHTGMRGVFVGSLCVMALFLFIFKGTDRREDLTGSVAGMFVLGVAWFPVAPAGMPVGPTAVAHYICAFGLFTTMAVFSLFLFSRRKGSARGQDGRSVHIICGLVIVICIAAIIHHTVAVECSKEQCSFVLWVETMALTAFSSSWILERPVREDLPAQEFRPAA